MWYSFAQLLDRYEAMKQAQPQRHKMLGIAWGKNHLEVWRFGGEDPDDRSCVRSNLLHFAWEADNNGFQVSVPGLRDVCHAISVLNRVGTV